MKACAVVSFCIIPLLAYGQATPLSESVVEMGPHHRVVEWTELAPGEDGQVVTNVHNYTEMATGMNWWDPSTAQWQQTVAAFEISPEGSAVAARGQHKVIIAGNINEGGSVDLEMADGQRLRSNPMGLSFFDTVSGQNVLLAEVKDCTGELIAPNVLIFPDAFDNLKAALRYTYSQWGFEQDVILYQDPGSPEAYGLDPATTRLEMYTEFFDPPQPTMAKSAEANAQNEDADLEFGAMRVGPGQAYFLHQDIEGVPVKKEWVELEKGRHFLIEGVPFKGVEPLLEKLVLPAPDQASNVGRKSNGRGGLVAHMRPKGESPMVASIQRVSRDPAPGLVLDYQTINTSTNNHTFRGDTTYYITALVDLNGTTTFEAGTVVKFANSGTPQLRLQGGVIWEPTPYLPAVFTAKDDDSVGEQISGSTGSPSGTYAAAALRFAAPTADIRLENLRVKHAALGVMLTGPYNLEIRHAQFVRCQHPLYLNGYSATRTLKVANVLVDGAYGQVFYLTQAAGIGENMTIRDVNLVVNVASYLSLTNSILSGVTNWTYSFASAYCATNSGVGVYQSIGAGNSYLANSSNYRDVGTNTLSTGLAEELRSRTTYPPVVMTGDLLSNTTLSPQAIRDTGLVDLGYHYDPLDYCWSALNLTNCTLLLTNGVAVAWYGPNSTTFQAGAQLVSEGTAERLNRWVRYNAVQEQSVVWGSGSLVGLWAQGSASPTPSVRLRFTDLPTVATTGNGRTLIPSGGGALNPLAISHSQLRGVYLWLDDSSVSASQTIAWTNNVVDRCFLEFRHYGYYSPFALYLYNQSFRRTALKFMINASSFTVNWNVYDNLFDCESLISSNRVTHAYNGYASGLTVLPGSTSGNKTGLVPDYQGGPATNLYGVLGKYYYPQSGGSTSLAALVSTGSRGAGTAGLWHFTTATNQLKEGTTQVDIGYHYVALDGYNVAQDFDGDGLADYIEDRNGNGSSDTGETDWQTSTSGISGAAGMQVFTPLKN